MEWPTLEVRWFFGGPRPDRVAGWFESGATIGPVEARTDEYLRLPGRRDLGIKTRGGLQLDVKLKTGDGPEIELPPGLAGRVEAWSKWSFALDTASVPGGPWVRVDKRRRLRRYAFADGTATGVGPDVVIDTAGCSAELVAIQVDGRSAWGFGFEAYGDAELLPEALAATCARLVAESPLGSIAFRREDSHSYPSWLCEGPVVG